MSKNVKWTLEMAQQIAINKGGKLISKTYKTIEEKLIWSCGTCGHEWPALLSKINCGQWCPICNKGIATIDQLNKIIKNNDGKCLTDLTQFINGEKVFNNISELKLECKLGHIFKTTLNEIKEKEKLKHLNWCSKCNGRKRYTYDEVKKEIELRGWHLLSDVYKNQDTKLEIICTNNHKFEQTFKKIVHRGYGCKYCDNTRVCENICRIYFETMFSKYFPTVRPAYMEGLELDGYCAELGIAFEHQGPQHYSLKGLKNIHSSKTEEDFQNLLSRDIKK